MEDQSTFREFCGRHLNWSTVTEYLYHRWTWICSFCHGHNPAILPCYSLIHCTKSGSLRFSQLCGYWLILSVYILMSFDFPFARLIEFGNFVITLIYIRFCLLTIVSLFVLFFLYFLINGLCLLRWYLQTFHWQTHNREEVT